MLESGFTSCEDELLENVTASLVSSAYTDDGGTWKSSSGSTVESLTKCEDLDMEEECASPPRVPDLSLRLDHKPPRWADVSPHQGILSPRAQPDSLSPREPLSPRTEARPRRSGIPVVHQTAPLQTKLLTKCQSLQDLSKCLALLHTERLNNTYNSTDTINSQSLSSTKDSGKPFIKLMVNYYSSSSLYFTNFKLLFIFYRKKNLVLVHYFEFLRRLVQYENWFLKNAIGVKLIFLTIKYLSWGLNYHLLGWLGNLTGNRFQMKPLRISLWNLKNTFTSSVTFKS